jgi:uncharacterized membrane protein
VVDEIAVDTDHIIGMAFDKTSRADEVLLNLSHLAGEGQITLTDAVVVYKGDDERVHVRQTTDPTPKQGAMSGALWGLLIGSLFGPAGFLIGAGAGAASGGLMGKLVDVGLDDDWVKEVANWIEPGTSALLVLVSEGVRPVVLQELSRFEGRVLYCTFPGAVRHELDRALSHGTTGTSVDDPSAVIFDQPSA